METLARFDSETGTVSLSRLPSGELYIHDLEGDAMLFLRVKNYCNEHHAGEDVIADIDFGNERMFSALTSAGLYPYRIVFKGKA
jgi:hypothetical protein